MSRTQNYMGGKSTPRQVSASKYLDQFIEKRSNWRCASASKLGYFSTPQPFHFSFDTEKQNKIVSPPTFFKEASLAASRVFCS